MTRLDLGLGLDLELAANGDIDAIGAILDQNRQPAFRREHLRGRDPGPALRELDAFAAPASFLFGHNLLQHDLPRLRAVAPDLALLRKPVIDTLPLSVIAFAEHPYHALVKDYKLVRVACNDPVADAGLARTLLHDIDHRLRQLATPDPTFVATMHALLLHGDDPQGTAGIHHLLDDIAPPVPAERLDAALQQLLLGSVCTAALQRLLPAAELNGTTRRALTFALAWLRVAGRTERMSASVLMPWVWRQHPEITTLLQQLRCTPCARPDCDWCRNINDPQRQLQRWFGYHDFRRRPQLADGRSAQQAIVAAGFAERSLLALLPTGGGKSLCFQLPAIVRYLRSGSLTLVVSPLQSLMHDQVENFADKTGQTCAAALTGRLTPPERRATLDAVTGGACGILYVSPEQLRNPGFTRALAQRQLGAVVFDEAHCLAKWGHDFRPDYLYAARFLDEFCRRRGMPLPPIVCVTATAKPEVRDEIRAHFRDQLDCDLEVFDGHAPRQNLTLHVERIGASDKGEWLRGRVAEALQQPGSVLVYTATRSGAERTAARLAALGLPAEPFHAGLEPPRKKDVQARFLRGELRLVCATNAFGMGIDKPDIRLVVHFQMPGSLEAYVQEVGRAGRDGQPASAVLLLDEEDAETQFQLAASSRLDLGDLQAILRRIRGLARETTPAGPREAVCTTGEILRDAATNERIDPGDRGAPTKVVTAIAWLERGQFLRREQNETAVFQGRPLVKDMASAEQCIHQLHLPAREAANWRTLLRRLFQAEADEGLTSDDLLAVTTPGPQHDTPSHGRSILRTLWAMQQARLLSKGTLMTAFLRHGVADGSRDRLVRAAALERQMLARLREQAPDADDGHHHPLSVLALAQALTADDDEVTVDDVRMLLLAAADRSQFAGANAPGLRVQFFERHHCRVAVQGGFEAVTAIVRRRHAVADVCLRTLLGLLPSELRGKDLLVQFDVADLLRAVDADLELRASPARDPVAEIEHALMFLHRVAAIALHKGLAVFRQAMTLRLQPETMGQRYGREHFAPLAEHQDERMVQIHVMHEFASRMAADRSSGMQLLDDYFTLDRDTFLQRHFARRRGELQRATGAASWQRIVRDLSADQRRIVEAPADRSLLVLAGPGSGKTRAIVHRCAYLLRALRVPASGVLVLCYNRSACLEIRQRLRDLVGDDARGVLVQTYHGMAARLCGRSPADLLEHDDGRDPFAALLQRAIGLLRGPGMDEGSGDDDLRDRLLHGFRHILVDEYQDIDEPQYELVAAIAGRTLHDKDRKLAVLAVGDDDQNIYRWRGSSVQFLRRFEQDYAAERIELPQNFRSTAHIVAASSALIAQNGDRMKRQPLRVDAARAGHPAGGRLSARDPLAAGRVHVLEVPPGGDQAAVALLELQRLAAVDADFAWHRSAVLAWHHAQLDAMRHHCERHGVPVRIRVDGERAFSLFRLRAVQQLLAHVAAVREPELSAAELAGHVSRLRRELPDEASMALIDELLAAFAADAGAGPWPRPAFRDFCGELLQEQRRERTLGHGLLLSTVHGSKGCEFDHVLILDGGFGRDDRNREDERRLYYVAMTRARHSLALLQSAQAGAPWLPQFAGPAFHRSAAAAPPAPADHPRYRLLRNADLWLGFGGLSVDHAAIDRAVRALRTGDPLQLVVDGDRLSLRDCHGNRVGALSETGSREWLPRLPTIEAVRVAAVLVRRRSDEAEGFQQRMRRDEWLLVIPEVLHRPLHAAS